MSDLKIEAVKRVYEAYSRGDVDAVLAELADEVVVEGRVSAGRTPVTCHRRRA